MMRMAKQKLLRVGSTAILALCLCAGQLAGTGLSVASAEDIEISGPLAGAPAVRHMRIWRKHRLQLEPFFAFTLQDEYSRALMVGGELRFGILDWLGINAWGSWSFLNKDTDLTKQVTAKGETTNRNRLSLPSKEGFPDQIGTIDWMAGVDVAFTPLRGKVAMFQKIFLDVDLSLFAGVGFTGITERADSEILFDQDTGSQYCIEPGTDPSNTSDFGCLDSQTDRSSRVAIGASFGVAMNVYFHRFMGIALRWRGMPFKWNTGGTDESGAPEGNFPDGVIDKEDRIRQFNHLFSVGFIFVLPPNQKSTD